MAKRKAAKRTTNAKSTRKSASARPARTIAGAKRRSVKKSAAPKRRTTRKPVAKAKPRGGGKPTAAAGRKKAAVKKKPKGSSRPATKVSPAAAKPRSAGLPRRPKPASRPARLDRARRSLADDPIRPDEQVPTPPSSLNMDRRGSAARSGRAEIAESLADHASMTPDITGGDVDASIEDAYFSGDEAPGGDNPTPDQDIVDDIGKALGVQYEDNEELRASDKVTDRDKNRWELDPASAEDYRDRDRDKG